MTGPDGAPLLSGRLDPGGAIEVLRRVESQRASGTLRFRDGSKWRHVTLVCGEIAVDQPLTDDSVDPVECFLGAREGEWEVYQELPALPVSRGDALVREGSLAVHDAAGLLRYCERAGLTGRLVLSRTEPRRQRCEVHYEAGELMRIRIDGAPSEELGAVFAWDEGTFRVEARRPFEPEASGLRFVRVVEMELARVMESAVESALLRLPRPDAAPPPPERPPTRPRLAALTPTEPPAQREETVKIVYLDLGEASREDTETALIIAEQRDPTGKLERDGARGRREDDAGIVAIEPRPQPAGRGSAAPASESAAPRAAPVPTAQRVEAPSVIATIGWVTVYFALFAGVVALLGVLARSR